MDKKTITALKESIEKWEFKSRQRVSDLVETGPEHCPLCVIYNNGVAVDCEGCPVSEATGRLYCVASPYEEAYRTWMDWHENETLEAGQRFRSAARKEAAFLKSLLPKTRTTKSAGRNGPAVAGGGHPDTPSPAN